MAVTFRKILIVLIAAGMLTGAYRWWRHTFASEEDRLRRVLYSAKRHAEREELLPLRKYISPAYEDDLGNDRRSLLMTGKHFFDTCKDILISLESVTIEIEEPSAKARIEGTVYWREHEGAAIYYEKVKADVIFSRYDNSWRISSLVFFEPEQRRLFSPSVARVFPEDTAAGAAERRRDL